MEDRRFRYNPSQELESWSWKKLDCTGIIPPARQLLMLGVGSVLHTKCEKEITLIPKRSLGVMLQQFCVIHRFCFGKDFRSENLCRVELLKGNYIRVAAKTRTADRFGHTATQLLTSDGQPTQQLLIVGGRDQMTSCRDLVRDMAWLRGWILVWEGCQVEGTLMKWLWR